MGSKADKRNLRVVDKTGRAMEMFRCDKLSARLLRRSCAVQHVAANSEACARCDIGHAHAVEFGLRKENARRRKPARTYNRRCVRDGCGKLFVTDDRRAWHCEDCRTSKQRLKDATKQAAALLRDLGHDVRELLTPNGTVIVYRGEPNPDHVEEALKLLVFAGYAVRADAFSTAAAIAVIDTERQLATPNVRVRFGEQRMRRRYAIDDPKKWTGGLDQLDLLSVAACGEA